MKPTRSAGEAGDTTLHYRGGDPAPGAPLSLLVSCASGVFVVPLASGRSYVLGRAHDCDVPIADASISRRHASIVVGDPMTIEDLGSTNGVSVQGQRIATGDRATIGLGAVIEIGSATLLLQRAQSLGGTMPPPGREVRIGEPVVPGPSAPVVRDATMTRLYAMLDVIAPSPLSVLLLGETGVGKEVFAEVLHKKSLRAASAFLKLNCAAVTESLLESELFGHEKGAFTGAVQAKPGLFEAADGGTLFLDEVGEMALSTQAKLLRVLETGEVTRIGTTKTLKVDVRFIAATNRDLRQLIAAGAFRPDLFFRLNGISITLPPLRKRVAEIEPLARRFAERAAKKNLKEPPQLTKDAIAALEAHDWPGNVRELRNVMDRAVVLCRGERLDAEHLLLADPEIASPASAAADPSRFSPEEPSSLRLHAPAPPDSTQRLDAELRPQVQAFERQRVIDALARVNGNQTKAAALLGVSRRTLINKIEAYGLERPRKK